MIDREGVRRDTERERAEGIRALEIGDTVTYDRRRYTVVGFTPSSVIPAEIQLRDPKTGSTFWVEWPSTERVDRAALRLAKEDADPPE